VLAVLILVVLATRGAFVSTPGAHAAAPVCLAATATHGFLLSEYESALLDGINAQRARAGLPALRLSGGATDVARRWARARVSG